jgi:toxin ParE1/3/4
MQLRLSRRAQIDLVDIADYIAEDNPERAATFVEQILGRCRELLAFPRAGRPHPELGLDVRATAFRRYLIIYVVSSDILEVRRIVHGARNLRQLMT